MLGQLQRKPGPNGAQVLKVEHGAEPDRATATGLLLVGTPATIRQLSTGLSTLARTPAIAGAILVDATEPSNARLPVPVLGVIDDIPTLGPGAGKPAALVCIPERMCDTRDRVAAALRRCGIQMRVVSAMEDVIEGRGSGMLPVADVDATGRMPVPPPNIDLAALIGRQPYQMDRPAISAVLRGRCILITGAGGSIGSELAKVAAEFEPSLLVLMERSENALFEIDRQIARHFPKVARKAVLHDVVDAEATLRLCEQIRPHVVFHAAAHKHVPLMEDHPAHAVTNNLFGTKSIADAAVAAQAERFVMISSDKAVNPTSVMGATKRLAEIYVRGLGARTQATRLSMVRFGNVLGSNASVLTIWAQQIAEGGPITITDPRMTRYFMTIPEAATLVVQSTTLDPGGAAGEVGVYVLDMGKPVRIMDLAERFIRAHGLTPWLPTSETAPSTHSGKPPIQLVITGIRPGEKIHEELAYAAEQLRPTTHPGVRAWAGPGFESDIAEGVNRMVRDLGEARFSPDPARVVEVIRTHVPEMRSSNPSPEPAAAASIG